MFIYSFSAPSFREFMNKMSAGVMHKFVKDLLLSFFPATCLHTSHLQGLFMFLYLVIFNAPQTSLPNSECAEKDQNIFLFLFSLEI
jgi:hypothetical protein